MKTIVWTDGSCNANGEQGVGGWAALIRRNEKEGRLVGRATDTTQHRMELTAVCEALEQLSGAIEVRTDTPYIEKCFSEGWHKRWRQDGRWRTSNGRPVANRDLWERLFALVEDGTRHISWVRVKGHGTDENNNIVDRLAREAALASNSQLLLENKDQGEGNMTKTNTGFAALLAAYDSSKAQLARFLRDHPTTNDKAWTRETRLKGETREAFIERLLG
jgi:ribonuclease HI